MVHFIRRNRLLSEPPILLTADEEKNILVFLRKNCIFALNFNPTESFGDYGFSVPAGKYTLAFSSDDVAYNGQGRLQAREEHFSIAQKCPNGNQEFDHTLYLYLPSRCAVVLEKTK